MDALRVAEIVATTALALGGGTAVAYAARRERSTGARTVTAPVPKAADVRVPLSALLPTELPVVDGLRLSVSYVPGAGDAAGGNFYDAFYLHDDTLALAIGDAAGSGMTAVAAMNVVRQALRNAFIDGAQPAEALRRANRMLFRGERPSVVTALAAILDPATLLLSYASAAHPVPLLAIADGSFETLPASEPPLALGVMTHHVTAERRTILPIDALLAFYTHGAVANGSSDDGVHALGEALCGARTLRPNKPAVAIDRAVLGDRARRADATILTVAPEPTLVHLDVRLPADAPSAPLARAALRRFFAGTTLDERRTYDALVATGEAISNVIEHAYERRPHHWFTIHARHENDACVVFVEDSGRWRQDAGAPDGRGISMMRTLSDDCRIERTTGGTRVILRFAFAPSIADAVLRA